jgi:hypothetical protein
VRFVIPAIAMLALALGAAQAQAQASSCSAFVIIKSYDAAASSVDVDYGRGSEKKFFPRPEGANTDTSKVPKKCTGRVTRTKTLAVKPTGGRLSVTQIRSNFEGKMLNDTEDETWLPSHLKKLIEAKTEVVAVVRPGRKDEAPAITTIYMPITDPERAEIARIDAQAEEVE